jgi:hypothetical protein
MSINNLSKQEIIDQLQMSEYQRDALRENYETIQSYLNIKITEEEMRTHNLSIHSDEDYSNVLCHKIRELFDSLTNQN